MVKNQDKNRYIRLDGYPLHKPLWRTFHQAAAINASAAFGLAAGVADYMLTGGQHLVPIVTNALGWAVFSLTLYTALERFMLWAHFGAGNNKTHCIDTRPERNTPPTSANHMQSAMNLNKGGAMSTGAALSMTGYVLCANLLLGRPKLDADAPFALYQAISPFIPLIAGLASTALRFNKVAKEEHVITRPPAKKIKERAASRDPFALPQAT